MDELEEIPTPANKKIKVLITVICIVLTALIVAVCVTSLILETFIVDGDSMLPTLDGGEYLNYEDGDKVIVDKVKKAKRGDIVVVTLSSENTTLIKRVLALGGDKVKIESGLLYVNGQKEDTSYLSSENKVMLSSDISEFTIPQNHLYLLGDNRIVSKDSRSIGTISNEYLDGVAVFIIKDGKLKIA